MSHTFDLKFNRMRENAPEKADGPDSIDRHDHPGHDRKVCFVLADGTKERFNYGLLIDEKCHPDCNTIVLIFSSGTVTLVGIHLDKLFEDFEFNMPRVIQCADNRYNQLQENGHPVVNQITITKN